MAEDSLRAALAESVSAYMDFLSGHPSFQRLVQREELAGGDRLRGVERESSAIRDAFEALRSLRARPSSGRSRSTTRSSSASR